MPIDGGVLRNRLPEHPYNSWRQSNMPHQHLFPQFDWSWRSPVNDTPSTNFVYNILPTILTCSSARQIPLGVRLRLRETITRPTGDKAMFLPWYSILAWVISAYCPLGRPGFVARNVARPCIGSELRTRQLAVGCRFSASLLRKGPSEQLVPKRSIFGDG